MEFEQIFYSPSLIIYACVKGNIKSNFETVYVNKKLEVNVVNTKEFPETIVAVYPSFIFLKNSKIELPKYITKKPLYTTSNTLKTNYINLFSRVFEKNYQVIFKLEGYLNVSPKMIFKQIQAFKSYKDIANVKKIVDEFINIQPKIETARDWYNNVKKYCPMFDYKKQIDDDVCKKQITLKQIKVNYDIRHLNELKVVELIESIYDDLNQTVIIRDDFTGIVKRLKKECDKHKVKYDIKIDEDFDVPYIKLKFIDLKNMNLKYSLLNFI